MQSALLGNRISIIRIVTWVIGLAIISPLMIDFFGATEELEPGRLEVSVVVRSVHLFRDSKFVVDVQYDEKHFTYYPDDSARSGVTWERAKSLLPGDVLKCKPTARMGRITGWRYNESHPIDCKRVQ